MGYYSRYPEKALPTYRLWATRELLYGALILADTGIYDAGERLRERLARWVIDDWEDSATMSDPLGLHVHGWVDEDLWFSRGGMAGLRCGRRRGGRSVLLPSTGNPNPSAQAEGPDGSGRQDVVEE